MTKRFGGPEGGVLANDGVDLDLFAGRVHALLGENGAGKSTLMSMLSGAFRPDAGALLLRGEPLVLRSPAAAMRAGIGMVHQRFALVEALTGAENLALAAGGAPSPRAAAELAEAFGLLLDPKRRVSELSMGERQRLEILKLLACDARILILDEPTSVLAPAEISGLYGTLRRLADQGRAVVLVTHKLPEIADVADEVSVLRRGRMLARNMPRSQGLPTGWDLAGLSRLMVGRELPGASSGRQRRPGASARETVLRVRGLCGQGQPPAFADVHFEVARGEVLAVVGVAGNGQEALAAVLGGTKRPARGTATVLGREADQALVAYVPEDRHGTATVPGMTLAENLLLSTTGSRGAYLQGGAGSRAARAAIAALGVVASGPQALARDLSGGNLQKFILARELSKSAPLLVVEQPTQGLDVLAVSEVHAAIRRAAEESAVVLVTGDPAEALALAGRVAVLFRGRVAGVVDPGEAGAFARVGRLMAGLSDPAAEGPAGPVGVPGGKPGAGGRP
ncbi:MAG: ATP-binding cassette domain-containing protein [Proteobacteria bacterium]|nr:ATP-binding cassette domain-containing protein [Pseudomonadota bacterium]MBU1595408.1 ATP-binding cassette domain-containing protein [Pseudomonadota bacterium]